jgi:hypothetical protein
LCDQQVWIGHRYGYMIWIFIFCICICIGSGAGEIPRASPRQHPPRPAPPAASAVLNSAMGPIAKFGKNTSEKVPSFGAKDIESMFNI